MRLGIIAAFSGLLLLGNSGAAQVDELKSELKALQGAWKVVEHSPIAQPPFRYTRLVFKGDRLTFYSKLQDKENSKENSVECVFWLDPSATPKTIDFTDAQEGDRAKPYVGLYELKGGKLRICYRGPGVSRPKDFDDKADGGNATTFITLEPSPGA